MDDERQKYFDAVEGWAFRAAQELQDFCDAARESGCELQSVEALIAEFDSFAARGECHD